MDKKKILVVDDDPYILMSLEFLMQKNGFSVMVARNGQEAFELIEQHLPDLILLDIMMPDVDGYTICSTLKSNPQWKHIHIVFLSAKTRETDVKKGLEMGASLYISKPFSTRDLMKQVKSILSSD